MVSRQATIKFLNIVSETDDTIDISDDDFQQLIEFYLEGTQLETENPGFRNVRKQLYQEDGMVVGEVTFDFDSLSVVRSYKFDEDSPFMYFVGSPLSSELLVETNGSLGRDWIPVVFWEKDTRELYVKTKVVSEVVHHRSLLKNFKEWQELKSQGQIKKPKPPKK